MINNFINQILPSQEINQDSTIKYNKVDSIQPIELHELSLISPMRKRVLKIREQIKSIQIERSQKKLALIIPYRNREEHLEKFIPYITEYLNKQNIEFEIIIAEQADSLPFNRAKLMNVGVLNASSDVDYFVFHDVDLLPENIDYRFCNHSLKLSTSIKEDNETYHLYKQTYFGGVTLVPKDIFYAINGFSNNYWQWGKEDDDFLLRHILNGYTPLYDVKGKYIALPHPPSITRDSSGNYVDNKKILKQNLKMKKKNKEEFSKFKRGLISNEASGVNNISDYSILSKESKENIHTVKITFTTGE